MSVTEGYLDVGERRPGLVPVGRRGRDTVVVPARWPGHVAQGYIDPPEDLADRRQVIFYDRLIFWRSEQARRTHLYGPCSISYIELEAGAEPPSGSSNFHLFGSSWGGMLAMQYLLDYKPDSVVALAMSGSPALPCPVGVAGCQGILSRTTNKRCAR